MSSITRRVLASSVCLFLLGIPASSAYADDWDQAKVTEIAKQLASSVDSVYRELNRGAAGTQLGSGQATNALRLKDRVRVARNEARHLSKALQGGKGHDDTVHAWKRLMTLVRDAREVGRKMFLEAPLQKDIEKANEFLDQLGPFYSTKTE